MSDSVTGEQVAAMKEDANRTINDAMDRSNRESWRLATDQAENVLLLIAEVERLNAVIDAMLHTLGQDLP